jgi:YidC/Oxa1 family membrane protein insertase
MLTRVLAQRTVRCVTSPQNITKRNIISFVQQSLSEFHTFTGLPWWATISASTVLVKTALVPLVRLQILASQRLGKAMPEINDLKSLLKKSLSPKSANTTAEKMEAIRSFFVGSQAVLSLHNASITPLLAYPIMNISLFLTYIVSIRGMFENDTTGALATGGMYWFKDLIALDDTMILPFTAISATYLAIEFSFRGGAGPAMLTWKDGFQCVLLLAAPITTSLPAGVFCYWIPSSLYGIAQNYVMKHPVGMKMLRIPIPPSTAYQIPKGE